MKMLLWGISVDSVAIKHYRLHDIKQPVYKIISGVQESFFFFFFFDKYGVQESSSKVTPENTKQVVGEILHFMNQNLQS
jgi:hypothetical protein